MATPTQLEVILSFKPMMAGLDRFVAGYRKRMEQMQAFDRRIQNGGAALQNALGQIGAVLGVAALTRFAGEAREADKVQAQLLQTLRVTGETGAAEALDAQATALQRVTLFSDESVKTVQRLLVSFGLSARQTEELTARVLDFAQATGQSAEAAAMLLGRALGGQSEELGRYKIQLDTTKGKVDALSEALGRFAGQARSAVPDQAQRAIAARFDDATESLGRAANTAAVPFLQALIPLLERLADWATANAQAIARLAGNLGDMAAVAAPVVLGLGLLKGAFAAVAMVVAPLRSAVVLLSGRSLLELNRALAGTTGGLGGLWGTMKNGGGVLAGFGSALASVGGIFSAAFAGFELGKIVGELEVDGAKLKNWVSGTLLQIVANALPAWGKVKAFFSEVSSGLAALYLALELGGKVALNPLGAKQAWADYKTQLANLAAQAAGELAAIKAKTEAAVTEFSAMAADTVNDGRHPAPTTAPALGTSRPAKARPDLNTSTFGKDRTINLKAELELERLALDDEYERKNLDLEEYLTQRTALFDRLMAIEREGDNPPAKGAEDLAYGKEIIEQEVLRRAETERQRQLALAGEEYALAHNLQQIEQELAAIEASRFLTAEEKRARSLPLMQRENELIAERLRLLDEYAEKESDPAKRIDALKSRDELSGKQVSIGAKIEAAQPQTPAQGFAAGLVQYLNEIPTLAQRAQQAVYGIASAFSQGVASSITGLIERTMTWRDVLLNIGRSVAQSLIGAFAQMAAQWIAKQLLMALFGNAIRAAQLAATAPVALATAALWAPAATAASIATMGAAAIVGTASAKAAIASSVLGFASGGLVIGPGGPTDDLIPARLSSGEFVARAAAVDRFGAGFFEDLNGGVLNLAALPGSIAAQLPAAANRQASSRAAAAAPASGGAAAAGKPQRDVWIVGSTLAAKNLQRDPDWETFIVDVMNRRRGEASA